MRFKRRNMPGSFRVPFGRWLIPVVGSLLCILLLVKTKKGAGIPFGIWMAIGQIVYFSYSFRHAKTWSKGREDSKISVIEHSPSTETVVTDLSSEENSE